jgi:predicted carbohydrate-binding protein with CBM5 and CBM33 domain
VGTIEAKKARQTVALPAIATLGKPVVLRVWQSKADGNANDAYTLNISSVPSSNQKPDAVNLPVPLPAN